MTLGRPGRLEITTDAVRYVRRNGQATIVGTDTVMLVGTFSRTAVTLARRTGAR